MRSELEVLLERLHIAVSDVSPESEHQLSDHFRLFPATNPQPDVEEQRAWLEAVFSQVEDAVRLVAPPPIPQPQPAPPQPPPPQPQLPAPQLPPDHERQILIAAVCDRLCTQDHLRKALATEQVPRGLRLRLAIALTLDQSVANPDPADQVAIFQMMNGTAADGFLQFDGGTLTARTWFSVLGLAPDDAISFGPTSAAQPSRLTTVTALGRGPEPAGPFKVQDFVQALAGRSDVDADQIIEATTKNRHEIEVRIRANKVIELHGTVRIDRPYDELRKLVDPRLWGLASSFFRGSEVLSFDDGTAFGPPVGESWSGSFSEVVMGKMFGITNRLHVTYGSNGVRAQCDYRLDEPGNMYLARNEGYFGVQRCRDGRSGCEATLLKVIRWKDDAPGRYLRQHWSAFGLREWFARQAIEFLVADVTTLARSVPTGATASAIRSVPAELAGRL